ncbi:hypothetical protein PVAP13_7NG063800 [Panicum virgatum]|uniref:Uncharacterized protein n=1 Tax=Panicum virgatum TaxID=38727 RepID=A0A8T0PSA3_PANVG|nr:hypothetical protein PVAP13_7NG063800 [Panicum virgatum]
MALPWWLATPACAPPSGSLGLGGWLAFLFLSPCPQRALLGAVDLVFLAASLIFAARRPRSAKSGTAAAPEREALLQEPKPSPPLFRCALALAASAVFAAASVVLLALALVLLPGTSWRAVELAFLAAHAVAHGVAAWTVSSAVRGAGGDAPAAATPPAHLRVFWLVTAVGAALFSASAAVRSADSSLVFPDDVLAFASLLVSLPLAYVAVTGRDAGAGDGESDRNGAEALAPPYAAASFLSRATFSWINPLISKGYAAKSLATDDVPGVSAGHRAEASYALFMSNWPAQGSRHPVAVALWLSFWPQFVLTGALGLTNIAAMYVGPSLIDRFVEFIRRGGTPWEGLRLVLILLAGKTVQTLTSHHYNFQGQLLGMRIRGALQTALYRKSLRLSTGARRAHGTGAIVNYVQVDAGLVSSAMHGLHGLWQMPLQIVVALLLLYSYLGAAVLLTLAVIAAATVITAFANKLSLNYQIKFIGVRDSRIRALTEMLSNIRVIKMQAWEEMFGGRVRELRQAELGWLVKFTLFMCATNVVFSSCPLAMTVLVFATYLAYGGVLDAGKVFTATSLFNMLSNPMRDFPQTMVSSLQAYVSLGRLNKFLSETEIDGTAVDRVEGVDAGAVAVKVQDGVFAWDVPDSEANNGEPGQGEESKMETVLKGIHVEVRKGELVAVVGMVGSGKSSLLSCIMGEMHKLSGKMFDSVLRAPMSFFDTTPSGRILSRASSDQLKIDIVLVFYIGASLSLCIAVITNVALTCQVAWPSVIAVLPLLFLNIWYRNHYIVTSRELTRLQGVTEAPVTDHLTETFLGAPTVRCFRKEDEFYQTNLDRINSNLRMCFHNYAANEWLGFRLELIGTLILCITAFLMISLPSNFIKKEFVGMSLSYGLSLNSLVYYTILISCTAENDMVAVERVHQYSTLPSEAAWEVADCLPSPNWPTRGDIDVKDLKVRYRQNTPLILKGITVSIKSGEKIGVVGRTGSGKSTLVQALFRIVEPTEGRIIIDNVDICTLGLHDLRSRFGVIPQEPVLFEGTVRSNIDPTGRYSEAEIWQALERCQLKDIVASKPQKLDALVADMGENWSVGQKQLLCFGRVILKHSRILFMDEATASVDLQTDAAIQRIIREEFSECTVISIAHRIPTVMDSDKVLVLDEGLVREFDAPSKLMGRPSLFGAMVQEHANRSSSM